MKKQFQHIDLSPVREEVVSSGDFLRLAKESPHLIARSSFVAPTIGKRDFGSFRVQYTRPIHKIREAA